MLIHQLQKSYLDGKQKETLMICVQIAGDGKVIIQMDTKVKELKMRLYEDQINVLKNKLHSISSTAQLYLFGSRVDDTKKGGDIDLLIVSNEITKKDLRILRIEFFKHFGEQKIDMILDNGEFKNPFTKHIIKKAILL